MEVVVGIRAGGRDAGVAADDGLTVIERGAGNGALEEVVVAVRTRQCDIGVATGVHTPALLAPAAYCRN